MGGVAAALGIGTFAPGLVANAASTAPSRDGGNEPKLINSTALPESGEYQSCMAMFGLTKENSDLATFDVVNTDNVVSPSPVIGTDIIPIVTITDESDNSLQCEATPGWTDDFTWNSNYFGPGDGGWFDGEITYPGPGYYPIPNIAGVELDPPDLGPFTPVTRTIEFLHDFNPDVVVTWSPQEPVALQSPWLPVENYPDSSAALSDPFFVAIFSAVENTGDADQADYLDMVLAEQFDGDLDPSCSTSNPTYIALVSTLNELKGSAGWGIFSCSDVANAALTVGRMLLMEAETSQTRITITLTLAAPVSPTTTTTAPPTTAAAEPPAVLTFTG